MFQPQPFAVWLSVDCQSILHSSSLFVDVLSPATTLEVLKILNLRLDHRAWACRRAWSCRKSFRTRFTQLVSTMIASVVLMAVNSYRIRPHRIRTQRRFGSAPVHSPRHQFIHLSTGSQWVVSAVRKCNGQVTGLSHPMMILRHKDIPVASEDSNQWERCLTRPVAYTTTPPDVLLVVILVSYEHLPALVASGKYYLRY